MKINAKESTAQTILGMILSIAIIAFWVNVFYTILRTMIMNKSTLIALITAIFVIFYLVHTLTILFIASNYQLILGEKCITFKSYFFYIKKEYKHIKYMKIINKSIGRFGRGKFILKIKVGCRTIYISLNSIGKQEYRALKGLLIKRTGKLIGGEEKSDSL